MHPILARGSRLAGYAGAWAIVGGLLGAVLALQSRLGWMAAMAGAVPLTVLYSFACLSAWYVSRSMPVATSQTVRIVATAVAAASLTSLAWVVVSRAWIPFVLARLGDPALPMPAGLGASLWLAGFLLYLLAIALAYVMAAIDDTRAAERRALQGQVLAREAELRSLRSQVDPHFLFNSLNSIAALTSSSPAAARQMCVLLGEFLRETLALGASPRIPLARELAMVERYLAIEHVRFGDRLRAVVDGGAAAGCQVPPLLLQPLVENAVTHGIAHLLEGGTIRVSAVRSPGTLTIEIENPCDPDGPRGTGAGVGLSNVRSRLRALYGHDAVLASGGRGSAWRAVVTLPAEEEAPGRHG